MAVPAARADLRPRWSRTLAQTALACAASLALHAVLLGGLAWLYRSSLREARLPLDIQIASVYLAPGTLHAPPPTAAGAAPLPTAGPSRPAPSTRIDAPRPAPVEAAALPMPSLASAQEPAGVAADTAPAAAVRGEPVEPVPRTTARDPSPVPAASAAVEWRVQDWLAQHRQYPRAARRSGAEGTVWVRFVLDRRGALRGSEVMTSSGHDVLDRAALELLRRASPFPALPPDLTLDEIELVLPIEYDLTRAGRG